MLKCSFNNGCYPLIIYPLRAFHFPRTSALNCGWEKTLDCVYPAWLQQRNNFLDHIMTSLDSRELTGSEECNKGCQSGTLR